MIGAGIIVLLFVAYQLWGTGLQHSAAQGDLGSAFEEAIGTEVSTDVESLVALAEASQDAIGAGQLIVGNQQPVLIEGADASEAGDDGAVDQLAADLFEADFDDATRQAIVAKIYPEPGEAFARLVIPDINVDQISVEGVSVEDLRKGPGHYRTTPNPGQAGNSAIAGHRTTYGAPFHRIDELEPGDPIFVITAQGTFEYRVKAFDAPDGTSKGHFIVDPSETWVLGQESGENLLTLTACHPKYSARQRIIVQAVLVGDPIPTIPRSETVELGPISIDSGSADERAAGAAADEGDDEIRDYEQVISDEAAADDDPSVDAAGNPVNSDEANAVTASTDQSGAGDLVTSNVGDDEVALLDEVGIDRSTGSAELTSTQALLSNTDDFGEGLNGDRTKIRPAIMWAIAGMFIWLTSSFIGRRLNRRWTIHALGLVPFGLVVWSAFVNIDQALPSY